MNSNRIKLLAFLRLHRRYVLLLYFMILLSDVIFVPVQYAPVMLVYIAAWLSAVVAFDLKQKFTSITAFVFFVMMILVLSFGQKTLAEKLAVWSYISFLTAFAQQFVSLWRDKL